MTPVTVCKEPTYSEKKKRGICVAYGCNSKRGGKNKFCYKHARRHSKFINPSRYFYDVTRQNARARGVGFNWSIEEFREFCEETEYLKYKGRMKDCYSLDRIDPKKPYQKGNVQILTVGVNSRKRNVDFMIEHGNYPSKEDLAYFKEQMKNDANPEPQFIEPPVDPESIPF